MVNEKIVLAVSNAPMTLLPVLHSEKLFPVRRVYCVGRNYAEHAKEMGVDPTKSEPIFFMKPTDSITLATKGLQTEVAYPPQTDNLHHEIELVVAIATDGQNLTIKQAKDLIFGYGVGVDLTRRDLQAQAKEKGQPWELAKGFDNSAPMSPLYESGDVLSEGKIWLSVDGETRQEGNIKDMIWGVVEVVSSLSRYFQLKAGDIIFTGTPSGVGPLRVGQSVEGGVEGIGELSFTLVK